MSTKQRLAEAIAALPESLTIEEAVERLYRAFKLKQALTRTEPPAAIKRPPRQPGSARGMVHVPDDFDAPLDDFADYQ